MHPMRNLDGRHRPGLAPVRLVAAALALVGLIGAPVAQAAGLIRDAEIEHTLGRMTAPIFQAAGLSPSTVDIYLVQDKSLNAFVAGGRNLFLHTGLLITLETPEEVLAVVAHETGHIVGGHQAIRAINLRNARGPALIGSVLGVLAGVAGGGAGGLAIALGTQSAIQRGLLANTRAEEAAADQAGIQFLERVGVNPEGMLKVLNRFRGQEVFLVGNVDPYLLTHPLSTERLQLVERKITENKADAKPYSADLTYWHARLRAKLRGFLVDPDRVLDDLEGKPETELTLIERAVALHRAPHRAGAMAAVDRLIALRPNDPYYIELKGQFAYENGDPEAAAQLYAKASALAPDQALLGAGLGRALLAINTPESNAQALRVLENARRIDFSDPTGLRDLATAYARAGDEGMANVASAERLALSGQLRDAALLARRATALLSPGSPGWIRAQDIIASAPKEEE